MADGYDDPLFRQLLAASVASGAVTFEPRVVFADTPDGPWTEVTGPWTDAASAFSLATPTRWTHFMLRMPKEG